MRIALTALAIVFFGFGVLAENDEPFNLTTGPVLGHPYSIHWQKVQYDWAIERELLERCRANRNQCSSREALQFLTVIDDASALTNRTRLGHLNRAINLAIRPMSDIQNYGVPEIWTAPLATLANGAGDCTDYAIAKYFALGEIGISANDRRLVVVQSKSRREEHAVLAVREKHRWLILDDRRMTIVDAAEAKEYVPLLVLDYRGVRQFLPSTSVPMAKATSCTPPVS